MKKRRYSERTRMIHGEFHSSHWNYNDHIIPPISASTAYRLESAERGAEGFIEYANPEFNRHKHPPIYIYDRLDEPTRSMLEDNIASTEGGEIAVCFSTGMAAISGALSVLLKQGDTVISHKTIYGCTYSLMTNWLPRFGIKTKFLDMKNLKELKESLNDDVMAVYFETPTNPTLEIIDITAIKKEVEKINRKRGRRRKVFIAVDNTFATPFCQRPLELGADVVVESLTKNIGGFGTDMGGAVIAPKILEPDLMLFRKDFGSPLASRSAWSSLIYGLPTLPVRAKNQMESAHKIAEFLEGHPLIERVIYPGLKSHPQYRLAMKQMRDFDGNFAPGSLLYFVLKGSPEKARKRGAKLINYIAKNALSITLAVSLGQIRTLIEHPSSMTHATIPIYDQIKAGIDPGGLRLSIGLEDPKDIVSDLKDALNYL